MGEKKGFTLIELLVVIVILAIIALIVVPKISNVIEESKQKSAELSALGYIDAIENYILIDDAADEEKLYNGIYQVSSDIYEIDSSETYDEGIHLNDIISFKGTGPTKGFVSLKDGKVEEAILKINNYLVSCQNRKCSIQNKLAGKTKELKDYYDSVNHSDLELKMPSYDFVQPWYFNEYSKQDISEYIKKLKRAGYSGIVFQYTMEYTIDKNDNVKIKTAYYNSSGVSDASALVAYKENVLKNILEIATANDFEVFIGLPYAKDWFDNKFTDSVWINTVKTFTTNAIDDIYSKYNNYSSFKGWYWPFEIYSNDENYFSYWTDMLNDTIDKINSLNDSRSLMISPFVSSLYNLEPNEIKSEWNSFISNTNFRDGDIINMQDSIGSLSKSASEIYKYISTVREEVKKSKKNIAFWLNIENFDDNNELTAASLERYKMQIKVASLYADKLSSFSYSHYYLNHKDKEYREYYKEVTNKKLTIISSPTGGYVFEDKDGMEVPIPKNFTIDKNNNIVKDGLIIKDNSGNEFVWIPVNGEVKPNCYTYLDDEYKTVHYTRYLNNNVTCDSVTNDSLPSSITSDETQIAKYGGFYVGRYETSYNYNNGEPKAVVKPSIKAVDTFSYEYVTDNNYDGYLWNNINYANAKNIAERMAMQYNYDGTVKTGLINGKQWDTILRFIHINDNTNMIYDSRAWGNYTDAISPATKGNYESGILKQSGSNENWQAKNIYDIAGNLGEWTSELSTSLGVIRSNGYNSNGQYGSATYGIAAGSYNYPHVGFRVVLYIK